MNESKLQWEDPNWRKTADEWIHAQTSSRDIKITGPIEQPHVYPWSTVMKVPTSEGFLFFKATAAETVYEAALTQKLAGWYADRTPQFVAVDTARGWMLMRDGGERLRESIRPTKDISPWYQVIPLFSELQI